MSEAKENSTAIELECPSCNEVNKIDPRRSIPCKKCAKSITGRRYKIGAIGVIPFIFGVAGYSFVDRQFLEEERYPLEYEYALVDACINGNQAGLSWQSYTKKQNTCLCAVEQTINDVPYPNFRDDQSVFAGQLHKNIPNCS